MHTLLVYRKRINEALLNRKFVSGEHNVDKVVFRLPVEMDGLKMAELSYMVRLIALDAGSIVSHTAQKEETLESLLVTWVISDDYTAVPGSCKVELIGFDADGNHKYKAESGVFHIAESLGPGSNLPPPSEIETALLEMQRLEASANLAAESAAEYAAAAAVCAQQARDAAERSADAAASAEAADASALAAKEAAELAAEIAQAAGERLQFATDEEVSAELNAIFGNAVNE